MSNSRNQESSIEAFLEYRRSRITLSNTPRVLTEDEMIEWAAQLARKAATKAFRNRPQKTTKDVEKT